MSAQLKTETTPAHTELLDIARLDNAEVTRKPFEYLIINDFLFKDKTAGIMQDYPKIKKGGSFPLSSVKYGAHFRQLIDELNGREFREAVEKKFNVSLEGKPTMFTVRGKCRSGRDGKIHTDTESKIITVLLYMNHEWEEQGGKLRLLNSEDLEDVIAEVPPVIGTMLIFKRSNNSYHGHKSFTGERKVIQMNWVTEQKYIDREQGRHSRSSWWKNLFGGGY